MAFASDQQLGLARLSTTSRRMHELKESVLEEWKKRVRRAFEEARELREPIFIDTIPPFYDNIVEAVTPGYPRADANEGNTLAYEHGGERARMTNYDPEILILEYQMLRSAILDVLHEHQVNLAKHELLIINTSIDEAIREAVMAFSAVVASLREQFMAALTHDMRTPLGNASMAAELITLTSDSPKIKELAKRVVENIRRVDRMAQGLLDTVVFHKGQQLRLDLTNFDMLEVINEVARAAQRSEGAIVEIAGAPVYGWWSHDAMSRTVENLIGNAVKYGDTSHSIRVHVEKSHEHVILSVHNDGEPIPVHEQEAVFQVFRRANNANKVGKQGWGVGLPYVRAVVESHGGAINLDSSLERGTTFVITMPIDSRPFQSGETIER